MPRKAMPMVLSADAGGDLIEEIKMHHTFKRADKKQQSEQRDDG